MLSQTNKKTNENTKKKTNYNNTTPTTNKT